MYNLLINKEHIAIQGCIKILSIKNTFLNGLSGIVLNMFPNIPILTRPKHEYSLQLNNHWISGFVTADGNFGLNLVEDKRLRLGYYFNPMFKITQHKRDIKLLELIKTTINSGYILKPSGNRETYNFGVSNINDILNVCNFFQ